MNLQRFGWFSVCVLSLLVVWAVSIRPTHALPLNGTAILQLTDNPANDLRPMWSADGQQIVFQSNRDGPFHIYLMNADGSDQRALTNGATDDRHPIWMRGGQTILFDSGEGTSAELWTLNLADGSKKQLTRLGGQVNFAAPSPDGQRVAFYLFKNEALDIWTARVDGSDPKPLTRDFASARSGNCTFACHPVAWRSDSQLIAYSGADHRTIWTMNVDGSGATQVVSDDEHNHFPWFLADGRLSYVTEHVGPTRAWTDAWALDQKSKQAQLLQEQMSLQGPMEWSPDGTKLLFHSPRVGNFDIFVIDLTMQEGINALQGTPVPIARPGGATTNSAPAPAATAAFVPAPGSQPEAATTDNASGLLWVAGIVMAGVVVAFAIAVVRDRR